MSKGKFKDTRSWRVSFKNMTVVGQGESEQTMAINDYIRTSSLEIYDSVSYKNLDERKRYNRLILGEATKEEVGQGSDGDESARPPSWTQVAAGLNHSFVLRPLSASRHEEQILNARFSGYEQKEISTVSATGSIYYSKSNKFIKKLYSVTSSVSFASTMTSIHYHGSGTFISGNRDQFNPFAVKFDIPDRGRIRDIRVWVEIVHHSQSGRNQPLAGLGIALRNPNVKFRHAHVLLNDETFREAFDGPNAPFPPKINTFSIPDFYNGTYLLWEGTSLYSRDVFQFAGGGDDLVAQQGWRKDRHIRTVFTDSSKNYNPRHLDKIIASGGGVVDLYDGSPNHGYGLSPPAASGNDVPWISDVRMDQGPYTDAGSPPDGWLTGPGGEPAENEFPTTGSNYGAADLLPVYPLLDDLYAEKREVPDDGSTVVTRWLGTSPLGGYPGNKSYRSWRGYRPGLRGKEIQGTWELLIAVTGTLTDQFDNFIPATNAYFRQARLEILYDSGVEDPLSSRRTRRVSYYKSRQDKLTLKHVVSGSGMAKSSTSNGVPSADWFPNLIYTYTPGDYGKTVGITDDTGSLDSTDFAVFTRMTGALVDSITGSTGASMRYAFLHNEFGTPYIPLSSGSSTPISSQLVTIEKTDNTAVLEAIEPQLSVGRAQNIVSVAAKVRPSKQTRILIAEITSGSS